MSRNVAVFVDVANVFYAAKAAGVDIDYVTLLKTITANRDLVRAYAYTGLDPDNENQKAFHNFLDRNNYKVVSKDVRKYGDGRFKANLDIELVVDLVRLAPKLDIAVVISGDGDFAPAIRAVQDMGVRVEVVSFRANTSSDLVDVADQFIEITSIAKVEAGGSRSGRRVAADGDEDLSMTEVPDKQSEAPARPRRTPEPREERGRTRRGGVGRPVAVRGRSAAVVRVGNSVIDADAIETMSLDDLEPSDLTRPAPGQEHSHAASGDLDDAPRRRRRRGGRGRRGRGEGFAEAPRGGAPVGGSSYDGPMETMSLADLDGDAPGGVPEYMLAERRGGGRVQPSGASRRALGSGPSRIADEVARSQRDGSSRSNMSGGMDTESVPADVAALLRSQLEATGRSAEGAPALSGKDAPVTGRGRGRAAGKPAAKKPAVKKPAAKKPAAKVALVKKAAARPKSKR
jgi:uncharacterized LabA/DUF88 family protein